ncbi:Hypothetical predicted protein, partial [Pelobates cultripes]
MFRPRQERSHITVIKHPDGTKRTRPVETAEIFKDFYKRLYNHTPDGSPHRELEEEYILQYLDKLGMARLNGEAAHTLVADILEDKVDKAISSLKGNKAH